MDAASANQSSHSLTDVRAVVLDAVGTLMFPEPNVAQVYRAVGRKFGSLRDETEIGERFAVALARHNTDERSDEALERRRWRAIVGDVFDDLSPLPDALFEQLWNHFALPASWQLFDDVLPMWQMLAQRGIRRVIASNFDDRLKPLCSDLLPLDEQDVILAATQLGAAKPNARFFAGVAGAVQLQPRQLLMIGDSLRDDMHGASQAGWETVWLDRWQSSDPTPAYDRKIRSLEELAPLLWPAG